LLLVSPGLFASEDRGPAGLGGLSLEDLLNVRISTVERKELALGRSASAVYVITREQIERSAAAHVPDLLRRVPGIQVARIDSNKWAISGRRSNNRFASTMLVLVDGRSILSNFTSGVYWEQNDLMVEDIERIEVIRNPGATIWGVSAVSGVINIITRRAADTQGTLVSARASANQPLSTAARYGGQAAGGAVSYRVFGKRLNGGPSHDQAGQSVPDLWRTQRAGGRLEWRPSSRDRLRFQGDGYTGRFQSLMTSYPYQINQLLNLNLPSVRDEGPFGGGYGLARWDRALSDRSSVGWQTSYQRDVRDEGLLGGTKQGAFDTTGLWNTRRSRQEWTAGANLRFLHDSTQPRVAGYTPANWAGLYTSAFLQHDWAVRENVSVSLGAKVLREPFTGGHFQPNASVLWNVAPRQQVWASVSRTVRPPTRLERHVQVKLEAPVPFLPHAVLLGNPDFRAEDSQSADVGYRRQFRRASVDAAAYWNDSHGTGLAVMGTPLRDAQGRLVVPLQFQNIFDRTHRGIELSATWEVASAWDLILNYTHAQAWAQQQTPGARRGRGDMPRHQGVAISDVKLAPRVSWQQSLYYVAQRTSGVPAYWRLDTGLAWQVTRQLEFRVGGENLLSPRYFEFIDDDNTVPGYTRRSAFVRLVWTR